MSTNRHTVLSTELREALGWQLWLEHFLGIRRRWTLGQLETHGSISTWFLMLVQVLLCGIKQPMSSIMT